MVELVISEKEQVEWVFHLTGGELEDEPWVFREDSEPGDPVAIGSQYNYWYEGIPDWVRVGDLTRRDHYGNIIGEAVVDTDTCRTVIHYGGSYGFPPMKIKGWKQVAQYDSSGETDCPMCGAGLGADDIEEIFANLTGDECPMCENDQVGIAPGSLSIGDGWSQVIYMSTDCEDPDAEYDIEGPIDAIQPGGDNYEEEEEDDE